MDFENHEQQRSLTVEETMRLFAMVGLERMTDFKRGRPLLYVFEESYRGDDGPFAELPISRRPSFARINNPKSIGGVRPGPAPIPGGGYDYTKLEGRVIRDLHNQGEPVELYAIDRQTGEAIIVDVERKDLEYQVVPTQLFLADEAKFSLPSAKPDLDKDA